MPATFILVIIIVAAIMLIGGLFSHRKQQERQTALSQLASELGWRVDLSKNYHHDDEFNRFSIFTTGDSRYAYNTLRGELSVAGSVWPALMGDYHYQTTSGTGKNRRTTTHRFSYLLVKTPYPAVTPSLKIRREHIFDRMASFIGFDDIDFESAEFSKRFHVKSSNKRFAYDVIHPRMMEFLLAAEPPTIDMVDGYCCIYTDGRCWPPESFRDYNEWMREFFQLWPSHLTSTLQS